MKKEYDLIVIGAGSGGVRAARVAAQTGANVAIIESGAYGGTCVNVGCVPKKIYSYGSEYALFAKESKAFGWSYGERSFDWATLKANKDKDITRLNGIYKHILEKNNIEMINGHAAFSGPNTLIVDGNEYSAKKILIATGSKPFIPEIPGSEYIETSDDFFRWDTLPESIAVVGGGYIALEIASILHKLGVKVHLIYRGDTLLKNFDSDISAHMHQAFEQGDLQYHLKANINSISRYDNQYHLELDNQGSPLIVDKVLYATGRIPNTAKLNLEAAGIETTKNGAVIVNEHFRTSNAQIYALGDVIDRVQLTPVAIKEAMAFVNNEFTDQPKKTMDYQNIPTVVFSHPQIATVGLSEHSAREQYQGDIEIYSSSFRPLKNTISGSEEKALIKLITQKSSKKTLGLHLIGPEVGEIIQGFAVAIKMGATKDDFDNTVALHPTLAEEIVTI